MVLFFKKEHLLLILLASPAAAQPMLPLLRAQAWPAAEALAAKNPDPLAAKLVTFIRLLQAGQATAAELDAFIADNPTWPDQLALAHRYAEALAAMPDAPLCHKRAPQSFTALQACAEAFAQQHNAADAAKAARAAWSTYPAPPDQEAAFLKTWSPALTQAEESARFEALEAANPEAAARQLPRLAPPARALAAARLALHRQAPDALTVLAAVPPNLQNTPALLLAQAKYLRRTHATQAALALWHTQMPAAEAAFPRKSAIWQEREALARDILPDNPTDAFTLADDPTLPPDQAMEATFLAGWIALEKLHDPSLARDNFRALAHLSHAAITQARAFYWLGRASPDPAAARAAYAQAATWPLTYYGQLAALAFGTAPVDLADHISAQRDPTPTRAEQSAFNATEAARAATILAAWQDPRRAADFLLPALQPPATLITRAMVANLALHLGLPDVAVHAARLAGRDGTVLPQAGWPTPVQPQPGPVPAPLLLALMRQESSFDPTITSAAGAHGLMQLMDATAAEIARTLHSPAEPLTDPTLNMRLGAAYFASLLAKFPEKPVAIAAYNAGPHRAAAWVAANDTHDMVDWIEMIPFAETRNYVQRVLENEVIYQAKKK